MSKVKPLNLNPHEIVVSTAGKQISLQMSNLKCLDSVRKTGSFIISYNLVYVKSNPENHELLFIDPKLFIDWIEFEPEKPAKTAEA